MSGAVVTTTADDRYDIRPGDRIVLVAEDNPNLGSYICEVDRGHGVKCLLAQDGFSALTLIREFQPDAITLDIGLPHLDGWRLLDRLKSDLGTRHIPVAAISARDECQRALKMGCIRFCTKPVAREQLDQATLRLHNHVADLSEHQLALLKSLHSDRTLLTGRNVLLVDDDIRNVFAMTSVLERYGMAVVAAESGPEALAKLEANTEIDIALMDIMLPEMDGYKVTQAIRAQTRFKRLPIVALTAKAIQCDRENCAEAR